MKKTIVVIGITLLLLAAFLALPSNLYLRKALLHGNVNIDDYKIFNNRLVKTGVGQPWTTAEYFNKVAIPLQYISFINEFATVAFVVVKDGKLIHESYFNGYGAQSLSNSFSVAKSITSLLVGIAIDEGKINSIDDPAGQYLEEYNDTAFKQLTIKNLLTMSSGLNWDEQYSSPFSLTTKAYYGNNLRQLTCSLKIIEQPGMQFKYLSCNTQILALIIEKATGQNISDYASKKLWQPIGSEYDALWSIDAKSGTEKSYCCFNSNARDFARIGQLVLNEGTWDGKQIVSQKYIEASVTPASWLKDEWGNNNLSYYGYQWWITTHDGKKVVYARGILGQYIFIVPDEKLVIVRLGEKRSLLRTGNIPSDIYLWLNLGKYLATHSERLY